MNYALTPFHPKVTNGNMGCCPTSIDRPIGDDVPFVMLPVDAPQTGECAASGRLGARRLLPTEYAIVYSNRQDAS